MALYVEPGSIPTLQDAAEIMERFLAERGFAAFNYGCPDHPASFLSNMALEWRRRYLEQRFYRSDRLIAEARRRVTPFTTLEALASPPETVGQREMEGRIAPHFMGLVIPIHGPPVGFSVAAYFTGVDEEEFRRIDGEYRSDVVLFTKEFHEVVAPLYRDTPLSDAVPMLTAREREVLRWSAQGKTSWEIAQILQRSEATVNNHFASARAKLGVRTRAHAAAEALRLNLIQL